MSVTNINPNPKSPIKIIYVPEFIYQVAKSHHKATEILNLHEYMNTSDIYHYYRLNEMLVSILSLNNKQLFDGFQSYFHDHPFITERHEEYSQWKKEIQARIHEYDREDHPTMFGFRDLGNINLVEYDYYNRILYLVNLPRDEYNPYSSEDYGRYIELLTDILKKVGRYNKFDDITKFSIFDDLMDVTKQSWFETLVGTLE